MSVETTLAETHKQVARCAGYLSTCLTKRKFSATMLVEQVEALRAAANRLEQLTRKNA